jgi:hypothetical protein
VIRSGQPKINRGLSRIIAGVDVFFFKMNSTPVRMALLGVVFELRDSERSAKN